MTCPVDVNYAATWESVAQPTQRGSPCYRLAVVYTANTATHLPTLCVPYSCPAALDVEMMPSILRSAGVPAEPKHRVIAWCQPRWVGFFEGVAWSCPAAVLASTEKRIEQFLVNL